MHSELCHYMEVLSHLHVHAALSPGNKPSMWTNNGKLNGPRNVEVSRRKKISYPVGEGCTVLMLSTP
jgi:hypothetical protein